MAATFKEKSITTIQQLKAYVDLAPDEEKPLKEIIKIHPMKVSLYYLSLINWEDPTDPIRKMVIPSLEELNVEGSYDTSGEAENTKLPGLQHKYNETAFILATSKCSTYCRYCFRKRLCGLKTKEIVDRFEDAVDYIRNHKEINNVLISGGDPLTLENEIIEKFLSDLSQVKHIKFIRIGSKTPVTWPSRFEDTELLNILRRFSHKERRIYLVTQFNHPREITKESTTAIDKLLKSGIIVNNQTVLLRGVNDDPKTLAKLHNNLARIGVNPYYVFQCRPVKRVKHYFQLPLSKGVDIIEKAKANCNGISKRFKYAMSHKTGKIEILGKLDNKIYFKYHQAKDRRNLGKIFKLHVDEKAGWLDDFYQKQV